MSIRDDFAPPRTLQLSEYPEILKTGQKVDMCEPDRCCSVDNGRRQRSTILPGYYGRLNANAPFRGIIGKMIQNPYASQLVKTSQNCVGKSMAFFSYDSTLSGLSIHRTVLSTVEFELKFDRIEYASGFYTAIQRCAH